MEGLVLTMAVELPMSYGHCYLDRAIMRGAKEHCDELWVDNQLIPWSNADVLRPETPNHLIKYVLKPGINYIPERAFAEAPSDMRIMSITLPQGLKTMKNSCFYHCHFTGNLILPYSMERICMDALNCTVDGVFHLPSTVKHISSLPKKEEEKDEIILPEGMISFSPDRIYTRHLHIPSTLRKCETYGKILNITIAPDNPVFILRDGKLINLLDEKREKLKKMDEISWNAMLDSAFAGSGLEMRRYYEGKTLHVKLKGDDSISFRLGGRMTAAKAAQAFDIANRFYSLVNKTFAGKVDQISLRRTYYCLNQKKCLFNYSFYNGIIDIDLSVIGGKDEMMETLILSQRFFSGICHLIRDIEKKYGRNHLRFSIK